MPSVGNMGNGAELIRGAAAACVAVVVAAIVAATGCAGSDGAATADTGGPTAASSSSDTTAAQTGTTRATDTATDPDEGESTAVPGDTSTGEPSLSDTSSAADTTTVMPPDDSACPPGEDGCPCDEGACDFGLMCIEETCGIEGACPADPNESNATEATATNLGGIEDCNKDGSMLSGILDGEDDVDWFRYSGDDVAFCTVDPARTLAVDGPVRFCKFAECESGVGGTEVSCPVGVTESVSPDGRPGCCSDDGFAFEDLNCPGLDDDATIYLRFDEAVSDCGAYTLSYHY